ncbi:Thioredoxin reductase [Buchnera aphidicola (Neophyllaphis podocarpi)]|uniref:thioredoxin-disulfide reductase n=1 Tax=Buchnera aphidicola TaxID=9 RepID=UPI003464AA41
MKNIPYKSSKLIIIGSGPAGYTASIYAARANLKPILITGLEKGGQLVKTNSIENWPGDINELKGISLMDRMHKHAIKFNVEIIYDFINNVEFDSYPFILKGEKVIYQAKSVIIATGSSAKYLNLKYEEKFIGKGISTCAICDGFLYKNKIVAVVGGGNTAVEEALYLSNIVSYVYLIHRREKFTAEKILLKRLKTKIKDKKIILKTNLVVNEIIGNENSITKIVLKSSINLNIKEQIKIHGLFVAIGHNPNSNIFKNKLVMKNGYIKTKLQKNSAYTETSIAGIFAAGDVTYASYKQAITSAASGCMAALDAERYLNKISN